MSVGSAGGMASSAATIIGAHQAAVSIQLPDNMEVRIADTPPPIHGQPDSNWKSATLESGVEVMVPPFIKSGDTIRLNLVEMKYMDRAKVKAN